MAEGDPWSRSEVEAIVADYRHMLVMELNGQRYNKTAHRRALQERLGQRSDASIERKHQNISAALAELRSPYIRGYKPLGNYQALLFEVVEAVLLGDPAFEQVAVAAAERPAICPLGVDFASLLEGPPSRVTPSPVAGVGEADAPAYLRHPIKRDYVELEARNQALGRAGEQLALAYERDRLQRIGEPGLSRRVEHVAETQGDGLGFDILSFEADGSERYIEVKTTAFPKATPFYLSRRELERADTAGVQFHLYRLYEFWRLPRMYALAGSLRAQLRLDPVSFIARVR